MKVSDLKRGTKILIPCSCCHYNRSITFFSIAAYKKAKLATCRQCASEENTVGNLSVDYYKSATHRASGMREVLRRDAE